jgi:membrane protein implicated in regulation of membrane protease activity
MNPIDLGLFAAAFSVCVNTFFLVFRCDYVDGLFGRVGLIAMCVAAFLVLLDLTADEQLLDPWKVLLLLLAGLAIFLARHTARFLRAIRREGAEPADKYGWRHPR